MRIWELGFSRCGGRVRDGLAVNTMTTVMGNSIQ